MKNNYFLLVLCFLYFPSFLVAQGGVCEDLTPLSFDNGFVLLENCFNGNDNCLANAETGPTYACLGSQPFPAWFSGEVTAPGSINFTITQNTEFNANGEPTGAGLDADFIIWGPFSVDQNVCDYNNLSAQAVVDCSFSAASIEDAVIPNAALGEIYVILITNFNQQEGFIKIDQTGGDGQLGGDGVPQNVQACEGDSVVLDATTTNAVSYQWEVFENGIFVTLPGENTNTLSVTQSGLYQAQIILADNTVVTQDYLVEFLPQPQVPDAISVIELLDIDNDGFETFDLTVVAPEILGGQDPGDFEITYFLTLVDATTNSNPIVNPTSFINSTNPQTIWFRIVNLTSGCFTIGEFDIMVVAGADQDGDGVPDFQEDINGNGNLEDDDTDQDGVPDYLDSDDDGDLVSTADEITGIGAGFQFEIIDTDEDDIQNYLDDDDDGDGILTQDEDYNFNGDPIDDDTNGNDIPDFLDEDVALSADSFALNDVRVYPNPATSHIAISFNVSINTASISVFDTLGKEIFSELEIGSDDVIDVSSWSTGIYFLKIRVGEAITIRRFVKQ